MDPSLLHRVPEENVTRAPVEYYIVCCERCETPLAIDAQRPDMKSPGCGACGLDDPSPLPTLLTVQCGQTYDFKRI
eukprot:12408902-Karenia_brevis.AAC.1